MGRERRYLHLWVALSGFAGMGLQLTWIRRIGLEFGTEVPAVLGVVLAVFTGLAVGAWLLGRVVLRTTRPARWAFVLDAAAGAWVLLTGALSERLPTLLPVVDGPVGGAWNGFRPFLAGLLIAGPAAMALGAGLAAAERVAVGLGDGAGRLGGLYSASALGAALGAAFTLILLQPWLGYSATFFGLAGILAASAAGYLRWWARGFPAAAPTGSRSMPRQLGICLFASGVLGLGYEMAVVRALAETGSGTVFNYAMILVVWLAGTAIGAGLWRRRVHRDRRPCRAAVPPGQLAWIIGSMTVCGSALAWSVGNSWAAGTGTPGGWQGARQLGWILLVVAPPTLGMGGVFSALAERAADEGVGVGSALGWNTLGCAVAPALVGVGIFPAFGVSGTVAILVVGYGLLGFPARRAALAGAILGAGWIVATERGIPDLRADGARLVESRRGTSVTAGVWEGPDGNRVLVVNGRYTMGGTASTNGAIRQAQIPLLLHPAPARALFLGMGTGITAASGGWHDGLEVEVVEISPEVAGLRRHFQAVIPDPPGWGIRVGDARRWVRDHVGGYDVVVGDLFHPGRDGSAGLFTKEHFMAMRAALRPGGLACQWLPVYQLDAGSLGGILRAWEAVFPGGHAWWLRWNVDVPVVGLMGFTQPPALDGGWFDRRVGSGPLLASLRSVGLGDGYQLMGGWLGSVSNLGAFQLGDWVPVDDRPSLAVRVPWLASGTPAEVWERMRSLSALREEQGPFGSGPGSASWRERLSAYRRARDAYLIGLKADMSGSRLEAENRFLESVRASPEFPSGYSQLLSRAVARLREDPSGARSLLRTLAEIRPEQTVAESLLRRIDQGSGAP